MSSMINTNLTSLSTQNSLNKSQATLTTSLQRLSSGLRINGAKDDAAGLAISERMTSQINGLSQATRNSNDAISMSQTAEGALSSISDSLQRVRELAVQSANGSNTDADRVAIQAESKQLLAEIDRVATQTTFNGKALLDGSAQNQQFQVGANAGQTVSFSIDSATTSALGSSDSSAITSAQNAGKDALKAGAFALNGVMIGPSNAASDTASTASAAGSSIAKAAAVNAKTAQTGVTATVNATEVAGSSMNAAASNGTVTINGVDIAVTTTADAASSRASVISAINAVSEQTGVTAIDSGSDKGGVKLTAADGRNIELTIKDGGSGTGNLNAASTGLATPATAGSADTYTGSMTLNSSKAIVITSNMNDAVGTGGIQDAGLQTGSYNAQTAYAASTADDAATRKPIVAGDFEINGVLVGASVASSDKASFSYTTSVANGAIDSKASSGIAKAATINAMTAQTGVTATVNATQVQGGATSAAKMTVGATSGTLSINGVNTAVISTTTTSTAAENRKAAVDAINAISGQTGVVATDTNDDEKGVTLAAADGRNITVTQANSYTATDNAGVITYAQDTAGTLTAASTGLAITVSTTASDFTTADSDEAAAYAAGGSNATLNTAAAASLAAAVAGMTTSAEKDAGTTTSTITLSSTKQFTISGGTTGTGTDALNLKAGTYGAGRSGESLDKIDLSTQAGANKALTAIDNALTSVNAARANMGGVQNRFSAVVSNLASTSQNLITSQSRIRDADFATETASLARGQILQQAGTAMLAQANSLPSGVRALLR